MVALGADPYTVLNTGISSFIGMQFGTLQLAVNVCFFVLLLIFEKQYIGFGTIVNMVSVGYTADFLMWFLARGQICFDTRFARMIIMAMAVVVMCIGISLYVSADMGMAPYDALAYIIEGLTKGKLQFRIARIICDITSVTVGFILALRDGIQWQIVGIGTVILAFFTGPLIQFFRVHWCDKMLRPFQRQ